MNETLIRRLLTRLDEAEGARLQYGVVDTASPLTVKIGGVTIATPAVALDSYAPADDDYVAVLVAGADRIVLGRVGTNVVARAQRTSDQLAITTITNLTDLEVSPTVRVGRRYRITGKVEIAQSVGTDVYRLFINQTVPSSVQLNRTQKCHAHTNGETAIVMAEYAPPTTESVTWRLALERASGSGSLTSSASATNPAFILVEDIGAA
jgi:hypothetical protein